MLLKEKYVLPISGQMRCNTQQQFLFDWMLLHISFGRIYTLMMTTMHLLFLAWIIHNHATQMTMVCRKNNSRQGNGSWSGTEKVTPARLSTIFSRCRGQIAHQPLKQTQIRHQEVLLVVAHCQEQQVWKRNRWKVSHLKSRTCHVHQARNSWNWGRPGVRWHPMKGSQMMAEEQVKSL